MSRRWIVAYDIASNRRRRAVARCLGERLERVQESVFEGWLTPAEVRSLAAELEQLITTSEDSVRIYPLGGTASPPPGTLGQAKTVAPTPGYWQC